MFLDNAFCQIYVSSIECINVAELMNDWLAKEMSMFAGKLGKIHPGIRKNDQIINRPR